MNDVIAALMAAPTVFVALFPLVNPFGTAFVLYAMTGDVDDQVWARASQKIAAYTFLMLSAFFLFGGFILKFFGVSVPVVQLSGGLVVASIGWRMLGQADTRTSAPVPGTAHSTASIESKLFYPYTFPTTVGPGALAIVMAFGAHIDHKGSFIETLTERGGVIIGILAIALVTGVLYRRLKLITTKFSQTGVQALTRILAFFVFCIGVGIAWEGWHALNVPP